MMLADAGADIIRIDRYERATYPPMAEPHVDLMNRGRRSVAVDLKHPEGVELVVGLAETADGLMEGFRPGVAERLGLGPGRVPGPQPEAGLRPDDRLGPGRARWPTPPATTSTTSRWPARWSPWAGPGSGPYPPLNLVGDFGGGGMLLAFGMLAAILHARATGEGQVVDAAMVDGAASLMAMTYTLRASGIWKDERGTNLLDTGAHFYEVYETSDGGYFSVGAIEPQFYAELIRLMGLADTDMPGQNDRDQWPAMKERFAAVFATKTRHEWEEIFEGSDACAAPVLSPAEAPDHPHNRFRGTFTEVAGVVQPSPSPRFGRTPGSIRRPPPNPGQHGDEALADWGLDGAAIDEPAEVGRHPLRRPRPGRWLAGPTGRVSLRG